MLSFDTFSFIEFVVWSFADYAQPLQTPAASWRAVGPERGHPIGWKSSGDSVEYRATRSYRQGW